MGQVIHAGDVKPDFEQLKLRWDGMLRKYYLDSGELNPEYVTDVPCPYCKERGSDLDFNLNGFHHHRCESCRTIYVSPRLSDSCIAELYSDEYYNEMYTRSMLPVFEKRKALIGRSKYRQTVECWGRDGTGRLLDIGAGIGEVTDVFREEGWETHAIEMNPVAVDWLRQRGHSQVFHGPLDAYPGADKFDVIMAWGVIEHVIDPDVFLRKVLGMLNPGGLFVSEVPHGESLLVEVSGKTGLDPKRILMGEQHIVLFSTEAYTDLHARNGFELVRRQTNGLDFDTIFRERSITVSQDLLAAMQDVIDSRGFGDLLRGFWRKPEHRPA